MKLFTSVCIVLFSSTYTFAQVPPLDSLEASLKTYYSHSWQADREEFIISGKGRGFKYVPSVGFTLGLPTVSFNSNKIYDYAQDQKIRTQKLRSLDTRYQVKYNEELNNLRIEYQKIVIQEHYLSSLVRLSDLKKQEFAIYQEAYSKKEMKPLEYINKSYEYEAYLNHLDKLKLDLDIQILELKKLARYQMKADELQEQPSFDRLANLE